MYRETTNVKMLLMKFGKRITPMYRETTIGKDGSTLTDARITPMYRETTFFLLSFGLAL